MTRTTVAQLAETVAVQGEALTQILALLTTQGQHSTPAPVAEVVAAAAPVAVVVEPAKVETPPSASDQLLAFVAEKGLAFAKGGRTYLDADMLKAQVRVLKTGKPEVLPYTDGTGNLLKRGVTHIAIGRHDNGKSTFTQFVYTPESAA